jgi:hypothetical protein
MLCVCVWDVGWLSPLRLGRLRGEEAEINTARNERLILKGMPDKSSFKTTRLGSLTMTRLLFASYSLSCDSLPSAVQSRKKPSRSYLGRRSVEALLPRHCPGSPAAGTDPALLCVSCAYLSARIWPARAADRYIYYLTLSVTPTAHSVLAFIILVL